jgi:hypothetical protein
VKGIGDSTGEPKRGKEVTDGEPETNRHRDLYGSRMLKRKYCLLSA